MNPLRNCVNARASPGSDALYDLNTVTSVQGPLHRRPGAVLNRQGFPHQGRMWAKKLVHETKIRIGTWTIGSLTGKLMELIDNMIHRKLNILCIKETKWVGEKAKEIDSLGFKLRYSDRSRTRNGVCVTIDKSLKDNVIKINMIGDRIIVLKIVVDNKIVNIISAYAPQVGLNMSSK
ncbi:hypothetical protein KFK09_013622 [Dendrobium nobile]|uniref:Uncharacterized protein n=1 Tax=Dendrobium nobile TaxID=94219 RepID=A0A8T3B7W8_DENNO|nr:hypothetical protein KFK09_013622 [Dendrobium nobile]